MAIVQDASSPALLILGPQAGPTWTTTTATTASFTPPANSLVVAMMNFELASGSLATELTISSSDAAAWTKQIAQIAANSTGQAIIWFRYYASSPGAITVTFTRTGTTSAQLVGSVKVLTGANSAQAGGGTFAKATAAGLGTVNDANGSVTAVGTGSRLFCVAGVPSGTITMTTLGNTTDIDRHTNTSVGCSVAIGQLTTDTAAPGAVTYGWTQSAGNNGGFFVAGEILAAAAATRPEPISRNSGASAAVTRSYSY